jgi:hypothetical protein
MPRTSKAQKDTIERVMHEFKEGALRIGGNGPRVKNPKQAIAIALREAGASNQDSPAENRRNLRKTKAKERKGLPAPRERLAGSAKTRAELYTEARRRDLPGRSRMSKAELEQALRR